jgi:hypothetical protein
METRELSVWEADSVRNEDWHIMICCNDSNGNWTGIITAIEVSNNDGEASFTEPFYGVRGGIAKDFIRIGRRKFPITGQRSYVGNILWDLATVTPEIGDRIMTWIKNQNKFQCEGGTVEFTDKYGFK